MSQALDESPRLRMALTQADRRDLDRLLEAVARGPHHLLPPAVSPVDPRVRRPPQGLSVHREPEVRRVAIVEADPLGEKARPTEEKVMQGRAKRRVSGHERAGG